ncbi:glycosyltransferase [Oculatella sp. LEGE 06141]|uniref:glycosyltransferase family 2 protein n=1 Tax=Oculatella sp. LEGE 06141 TaxID=1828648 RepID=UPI00187FB233|nr:glycosyltransferase [Oculatella sp. LEGE 06141]MBE9179519.1 glycosyltransferase [Oculatella sp. LEGE 06141]
MNQSPIVSILIPCYNADRWIAQAIQSALDQTYPNREVVVVDDGSSDRSLEIIKSFGDRIRWETGANGGGNVARNRLLELSTGEWLQYLDADDYLLPDKIEKQIQFLTQNSNADVIYSPHITEELGEDGVFHNAPAIANLPLPHDLWLLAIQWKLPQTGGLLICKQALIDINGWREDLKHCQDYDLYVRFLMANKRFAYCEQAGAVYRWWCSGTVTRRKIAEIYRDRLGVQNAIESHLSAIGQLTKTRSDAINQARFEYARRIYSWDKQWAVQVASTIRSSNPQFEPCSRVAPSFYRRIYKAIGFTGAEYVAEVKRKVWK